MLNQYVKTISNGTATAVTNAAEIEVVTGAGTKSDSTTKAGATYTLARSKAATKTYVDKKSPTVTLYMVEDTDSSSTDFIYNVSYTAGSINQQAAITVDGGSFRPLTIQVNGTTKTTYTPNAQKSLNLQTSDFVTWQII